ncbi:hypothetical protein CDAR_234601 [Caerostris darwini]|uniref:Methylcytosine dioxygenase TET n=1 Tax=Caerostris darwini TaxID=1538125 RepID=A0AAV4TLB8_9ARAC|nr:hypothetical protein CDAR_234601 [Caerostris darwini]
MNRFNYYAAEEAYKTGRKVSKDLMNTNSGDSTRNSTSDVGGKINGNPQSYLSQGDSQSPSNPSTMHLGSQSVRSHDQYQPQGNSFQTPAMLNPYSSNSQYGSYSPQVPPHNSHLQPVYDSRSMDNETDGSNSTHRMTNTRLKTLIHNRQNQREHSQLIPICNPVHDPSFTSPVPLSPVSQQSYASPYLPPSNHQEIMHNSMQYSGPSETSSLMHLQQLSPNSITSPKLAVQAPQWSDKTSPWSEPSPGLSRKTPENSVSLRQKSPVKPSQNGHPELPQATEEPKMVNGIIEKPDNPANNCALDTSKDVANTQAKKPSENDKLDTKLSSDQEQKKLTPCESSPSRASTSQHSSSTSPRYTSPCFAPPSFTYRHSVPQQNVSQQQGCMPPPSSLPSIPGVMPQIAANGGHAHQTGMSSTNPDPVSNEANCDESNQSSSFLLNTTTSMNTYINITNTYNSKLSFSNATCLPMFASPSVCNSTQAYINSYSYNSQQTHFQENNSPLLPKGGGTSKSYIDSGRIQDSFNKRIDIPYNFGHQDLPLQPSPAPNYLSHYPNNFSMHASNNSLNNSCSTHVGVGMDKNNLHSLERIEKLRSNLKPVPPECDCIKKKGDKQPYYTHLGSGASVSAIRELMENRSGEKGNAIRIEKLLYCRKEGMTTQGCPLAKWIIRRSGPEEKLLTVIRHRPGHTCPTAYIVVAMVAWEGVSQHMADMMYETVVYKAGKFGNPTPRGCATNQMRTCVCQGLDAETRGACFSFGCSMNRFFSTCKFASSKFEDIHKFRLSEEIEEKEWEDQLTTLASDVALLYKKMAPESFYNQTEFEEQATDCRLGIRKGRPFSGVTACIDFCAHTHTDKNNMNNGCTVVVTLSKHKGWEKPEDEQLHVLPMYRVDNTDEYGSRKGQDKKIASGALEILQKFPMDFMIRSTPLQCLKKKDSKSKKRLTPEHIQAFQAALKQFVAIGKLRRVEPLNVYQKCSQVSNTLLPLPSHNQMNDQLNNKEFVDTDFISRNGFGDSMQSKALIPSNSYKREETPCEFYVGKHISHSSYSNNTTNISNQDSMPQSLPSYGCYPKNSSFSPPSKEATPKVSNEMVRNSWQIDHSYTNISSKISDTYVTSSCNNSYYYNSSNNCMSNDTFTSPYRLTTSQNYQFPNTNSTNLSYYPSNSSMSTNTVPPTLTSQSSVNGSQNSCCTYSPTQNFNNNHFQNDSSVFHNQSSYLVSNTSSKTKNCNDTSTYCPNGGNGNYMPYSANETTVNNNFCGYEKSTCNFTASDPQNNVNISSGQQQNLKPLSDSNLNKVSSPHYQNSVGNQNSFEKTESINYSDSNAFSDKCANQPIEIPDSMYALRDLDSKSVNCFSKVSQEPIQKHFLKKEIAPLKTEFKYCENNNYLPSKNSISNYSIHAKNYNYHLFQSNLMVDYGNFSDKHDYNSNNSVTRGKTVSNTRDLESNRMVGSPWGYDSWYSETNQSEVFSSEYSSNDSEDDENFTDLVTIKNDEVYEGHSDNESCFRDNQMGGVAIALTHGSVLFECAKHEKHSTTAVRKPNRLHPTRISLVFYQHRNLNFENHGKAEWEQKKKERQERKETQSKNAQKSKKSPKTKRNKKQRFQDEMPCPPAPIPSWVTMYPVPSLVAGGPYKP